MVDPATVAATAAIGSAAGTFVGIHRTFLDADLCKIARKMLGGSGVVMLVHRPHGPLALAEGIEKAARILDVIGWDGPVWATMGTGNMAKFPVLGAVPGITIFADSDLPGRNDRRPGNNAAMACADRWQDAGHEALVFKPPVEGLDWDDYLSTPRTPVKSDEHCSEPRFDDQFDPVRQADGNG
jgi:hypothetical protein